MAFQNIQYIEKTFVSPAKLRNAIMLDLSQPG